ncbi:hypothetical protein MXB_0, partial [Myxobolus squamalis]
TETDLFVPNKLIISAIKGRVTNKFLLQNIPILQDCELLSFVNKHYVFVPPGIDYSNILFLNQKTIAGILLDKKRMCRIPNKIIIHNISRKMSSTEWNQRFNYYAVHSVIHEKTFSYLYLTSPQAYDELVLTPLYIDGSYVHIEPCYQSMITINNLACIDPCKARIVLNPLSTIYKTHLTQLMDSLSVKKVDFFPIGKFRIFECEFEHPKFATIALFLNGSYLSK